MTKFVSKHARPLESEQRIQRLQEFWGELHLSDVNEDRCKEYAAQRPSESSARRELEELRAAINRHLKAGLHDKIVSVVLPDKPMPRERWLTKSEAAHLILKSWRYREVQNFRSTDRRTRRHVARFMIVARYMGSRASIICGASIAETRPPGEPWVDLTNGVFYGRPAGYRQTKKRRQTVRVPRGLLCHLRRWRANGQRYVVEWNGKPITRITKAHNAAVAYAGLGTDVTPHTWRHSLTTWLMQDGGEPWAIAGYLGMSVKTLIDTYGHHHPDHSSKAHAAFDAHRNSIVTDKREQRAILGGASV